MRKISGFKRIFSLLFIGLFLAACFGQAQEPSALRLKTKNKALVAELERVIPQLMKKANIPGLSIAVIRKGKIIWHKGFGIKNARLVSQSSRRPSLKRPPSPSRFLPMLCSGWSMKACWI